MKTAFQVRQSVLASTFAKNIFLVLFTIFAVNFYISYFYSDVFLKFREDNMTILILRENVGQFLQQRLPAGQHLEFEETISEAKKAELLGLDDGISDEAKRIMKELNITNAGENGAPVIFPQNLSTEISKLKDLMYKTYGYNALASSMISLNRALPDNRSDYCKMKKYPKDLPKVSIIIQFHDDDWMLLMRTVHSILLRSPYHLIEEILLIHDVSEREYFKEKLENYIKKIPKIRLIRSHRRQGIISARILGARNAVGPVLIFIDSHCEVTTGWLEPILARFVEAPNAVLWGKISTMSPDTMQVWTNSEAGRIGSFRWNLNFEYMDVDWYEGDKPTPKFEPKPSVTILGACFAIRKDFFHKIGLMDPDFDMWGGEDVELAFRAWMCGGQVNKIPCSVVVHMFKSHTYSVNTKANDGALYNNDRIAEIWLDEEYKKYYYRSVGHTKDRNFGNITERLELKKSLGCKSFKWFLENVHPKMGVPDEIRRPEDKEFR
ncbi:unnamed protein product [Chironomus riparius]|uniref:Glycosyltransferase 2-like domain-containing protein n=1 Tax=Chironomus riparius TaxID=315576 RepID=A0A9N9S7X8_9DIPT|nr:unnamed protein product [Chironomus riparius]